MNIYRQKLEINKKNIIKDYNNGLSIKNIKKKYGHDNKILLEMLKENNCEIRGKRESHLKYWCDENIFDKIDSSEKAYWLGFLYADGNIYQNKLQLRLGKKDWNHLKKFKSFIRSNHKIYKDGNCYGIQIRSPQIVSSLIALGLIKNKTQKIKFPSTKLVPNKFINNFILGYFDGDGCCSYNKFRKTYSISILGTENLLKKIKSNIKRYAPLLKPKINPESRGKKVWVLHFSGGIKKPDSQKKVSQLIKYFCSSESNYALIRKQNKFLQIQKDAISITQI